ncbi:MAG: ribonucleotide-diphosphate reductase subunit beta [Bacteroidota bacterium]
MQIEPSSSAGHWRRYQKAKKLAWNPQHIDLDQDIHDWEGLTAAERDATIRACALFLGGEEAVASDLAPLFVALRRRPGQDAACAFLASQIWEETKHAEFFRRWLTEVAGDVDLDAYTGPSHAELFERVLPQRLDAVLSDGSDRAIVRAVTTYHVFIEGMLAETGYHGFYEIFESRGIMPGLVEGIRLVQRDEARHVAFGLDVLGDAFGRDAALREVMEAEAEALFDLVVGTLGDYFAPYGGETDPFGLTATDLLMFASTQLGKRQAVLERVAA